MSDEDLPDWAKNASTVATDDLPEWAKKAAQSPPPPPANPRLDRKEAAVKRQPPPEPEEEGFLPALKRFSKGGTLTGLAAGVGENVLSAATASMGGLAGALVAPFGKEGSGAKVSSEMTYQPRTRVGKDIATLLSEPVRAAGEVVGSIASEAGTDMARSAGVSPETQGKIGAAAQTVGENVIPMAMAARGLTRPAGAAERAPIPGKQYSPLREFTPEQEARYQSLKDYNPTLGQVQRNAAQMTFEEHEAQAAGTKPPPAKKGKEKTTIEGVRSDLNEQLADQNKALTDKLQKFSAGKGPVQEAELGQLIQASASTKAAANAADLSARLNRFSGRLDPAVTDAEVGGAIQTSAQTKLAAKKADTSALYKAAEESPEAAKVVDVGEMKKFFDDNKTAEVNNTALKSLHAKFNELLGREPKVEATGGKNAIAGKYRSAVTPASIPPPPGLPLGTLNELYKAATNALDPAVAPSKLVVGQIKDIIRKLENEHGGDLYKKARTSRNEQGLEFQDQGGVARVVGEASRTDMKIDASQLPDRLLRGTPEDLRQTMNTLQRDVRPGEKHTAQTDETAISGLKQKAINTISEKGIDAIPKANLDVLFGPEQAGKIRKLVEDSAAKTKAETSHSDKAMDASLLPDKILNGTVEDLTRTVSTLNRGVRTGTETTRLADQKALAGLRQKAIEDILTKSQGASDAKGLGNRVISPGAFKDSIEKIGKPKLEILFGKEDAAKILKLADDAELLKVKPSKVSGSASVSNAQIVLDKEFTNRAAYALENVAKKVSSGMIMGTVRLAREKIVSMAKSSNELNNALEARHPTRASPETFRDLKAEARKQHRQLAMEEAPGRLAKTAPAIAMQTQDDKRKDRP